MHPSTRQAWKVEVWMKVDDGDVFLALIKRAGFTGASLARSVNCSRATISYLARGERTCTPTLAHKIAEALEVPLKVIFTTSVSRTALRPSSNASQKKAA
jgi:DNA-binding XRE family transcriptional regulator